MSDRSITEQAMDYLALGWFLFPVQGSTGRHPDDAKRPLPGLKWSQESTIDAQQVGLWFSGTSYGVAVDLGPSQVVVVDVDRPELFDLDPALLAGAWRYRGNPERMSYLFRVPGGRTVPQAKHPWGEVKAAGGYVVLPPSHHPVGGAYEWLDRPGDLPGEASEALLTAIKPLPPKVASGPRWNGSPATKAQQEWVLGLLGRVADQVATAGQGGRNIQLNNAAMAMGHYVPHAIDESVVRDALMVAARGCGLIRDDGERACTNTITSGLSAGMAQPQQPKSGGTLLFEDLPAPDEGLFEATPLLKHIQMFARARRVSPWSLLGATLARAVAETPPNIVLPGLVGGPVSIALYVALVGPSGTGKTAALMASRDVLACSARVAELKSPGSGEGLLDTFLIPPKGKAEKEQATDKPESMIKIHPNTLVWADEIQQLGAVQSRQGSTIAAKLRSMWTGQAVGDTNAHAGGRSRQLPDHAYRLALIAGVQPKLAGILLDDRDAGTPQRWLWMPTIDPNAPDRADRPEEPEPVPWSIPVPSVASGALCVIKVCDSAADLIDEVRTTTLRGQQNEGGVDGHALLSRLKVAAALSLIHGELLSHGVTEQWWILAGMLMEVSDATRDRIQMVLSAARRNRNRDMGVADAEREMAKAEVLVDRQADGWAQKVARLVAGPRDHKDKKGRVAHPDGQPCHAGCVRYLARNWSGGTREEVSARAIDRAVELGLIVQRADGALYPVGKP